MSSQVESYDEEDEVLALEEQELDSDVELDEGEVAEAPEEESEEVVVTIGEEAPPTDGDQHAIAPDWVKELRKKNREDQKRIRELEEQLKIKSGGEEKPVVTLGPKPKLEDLDYDADKYEAELEQWYQRKREVDEAGKQAESERKAQADAWNAKLQSYQEAKSGLKVRDFDDAEGNVLETLSTTQQGIILQGAENPAMLVYALGKHPAKAKELAEIKDPVKYAFAVAKLEAQLKVTSRKAPPPERTVSGTGPKSGTVNKVLEQLREEASRTGDFSKIRAYRSKNNI
jgi:hypothetical protein